MKYKAFFIVLLMLSIFGFVFFWTQSNLVSFQIKNEYQNKSFKVSKVLGNIFLYTHGYLKEVKTFNVTFTPKAQNTFQAYYDADKSLIQSMGITSIKEGSVDIGVNYNDSHMDYILSQPSWLDRDLYAYLCVSLDDQISDIDECYVKADNFIDWVSKYHLGKFVRISKKLSFSLVKIAYADYCGGTMYCGARQTTCRCSVGGAACVGSGTDCGGTGSCSCTTACNYSLGTIPCSVIGAGNPPPWYCEKVTLQQSCTSKLCIGGGRGETTPCTWIVSCTPVNGGWRNVGSCYIGGGGLCIRNRVCDSPVPSCGGSSCAGVNYTTCAAGSCCTLVNGGWRDVGSCYIGGGGLCIKNRVCDSPVPSCGGSFCSGNNYSICAAGSCNACTVNLQPDNAGSVPYGGTATFIANVNVITGSVTQVDFVSGNTSIVRVDPASANTVSYSTVARGLTEGTTTVRADVIMGGVSTCNNTSSITINPPGPWWQVKDGDITATNNIISLVRPGQYLNIIGLGGYPGVPVYSGSLSYSPGGLSTTSWNANTATTQGKLFDYQYFKNLIPDDAVFNDISILLADGSTATLYEGYEWYQVPSGYTIASNIDFLGRKVILFVGGGDLNINGTINLTDGVGFFGTFVNGNINIQPLLTGGVNPTIEGIYLSDGLFTTGAGNAQFHSRGSLAAYGGFNLQRDLANDTPPAEFFEYGPDQVLLLPLKLNHKKTRWAEVMP